MEGAARELLAEAENRDDGEGGDAVSFLRELLAEGMKPAKDVYREAEEAGFSKDSMKRAKSRLGVETVKQGMSGGWMWKLPRPEGSRNTH